MAVAEGVGGGVAEAVIVGKGFSPASLSFKGKEFRGWGGGGRGGGTGDLGRGYSGGGGGGTVDLGRGYSGGGAAGRRWWPRLPLASPCFPSTYTPPTFPSLPTPTFVPSLVPVAQVGKEGRSGWMSLRTTRPPGTSSLLGHTYPTEGQNIQELW